MSSTKINSERSGVMKTRINHGASARIIPDLSSQTVAERFAVTSRMNTDSGEADLYRAVDLTNGTDCVIKLYRRSSAVKSGVAGKLKNLNHPGIARLLADGFYGDCYYTVVPYYFGISLDRMIADGRCFKVDELRKNIIPPLVDSLETLHGLGIIHKDLKPANIIITEKEQRPVLIDFGISSETGGRTVVVTQTGRTPFYAAPETLSGAFSVYSDYYSLGICLYELYTGHTPFENAAMSDDELAVYAQMQKIPFPENFPAELEDLIKGLTHRDLGNRNEPGNPNRRWGAVEIRKWLNGEKQPVPGSAAAAKVSRRGEFSFPYYIEGRQLYSNRDLAGYFFQSWRNCSRELGRGLLSRHYEQNADHQREQWCKEYESELNQDGSNALPLTYALLYRLCPGCSEIRWKDHKFGSLQEYADALISASLDNSDPDFIQSAAAFLQWKVLDSYLENIGGNITGDSKRIMLNLLEGQRQLMKSAPLEPLAQALRLAYVFSERRDFCIDGEIYSDPQQFRSRLAAMYEKDPSSFLDYLNRNSQRIEQLSCCFSGTDREVFTDYPARKKLITVLDSGRQIFRLPGDFFEFIEKLLSRRSLSEFSRLRTDIEAGMERLGCLTDFPGREHFDRISARLYRVVSTDSGAKLFRDPAELFGVIRRMQEQGELKKIFRIWPSVRSEIKRIGELLSQEEQLEFRRLDGEFEHLIVLGGGKYIFRDEKEILSTAGSLWSEEKFERYEELRRSVSAELENASDRLYAADRSGYLVFEDRYFSRHWIGKTVEFGRYPARPGGKGEPLRWRILETDDRSMLVVTEQCIDCRAFHDKKEKCSWADSALRSWCNGEFFNEAFNDFEKSRIMVENTSESLLGFVFRISDRIFCLSSLEAVRYFRDGRDRRCGATILASEHGAEFNRDSGCSWWLRTEGQSGDCAAFIGSSGRLQENGCSVVKNTVAVRPACRIRLKSAHDI